MRFSLGCLGSFLSDIPAVAAVAQVERLYRDVRAYAIPGGSEEIMMDLGVRQAMKEWAAVQAKM